MANQRHTEHLPSEHDKDDDRVAQVADTIDTIGNVEQDLVLEELLALLREKLPNDMERLVLLRMILVGDHPRDVARDLGLPLHRSRIAKHRALKRLREDNDAMRRLRELLGDWDA